jgi:tetratricopeptide (TPR) repeat protein
VAEARSLILEGEVARGLVLLNEAAVATVSGELDPLSTGMVYCELVCAMQALAQYDLAEEWTEAMTRWRQGQPVGSIHGRCRVHRAQILLRRGLAIEAEKEILLACEELRPYLRRELGWPLTELGRIRLRMGDVRGAGEAFLAAHQAGWDPQPGLALVHLAHGNVALAAESIRDALARPVRVPSKELPPNTELRLAPLLEAKVEIEIAAGNLDLARVAAEELGRIARLFGSKPLVASTRLATGRVQLAEGDATSARDEFEAAAHLWTEVGAPFEVATARMALGDAHRADGNEAVAVLEYRAAWSIFEQMGARSQAARAQHACGDAFATASGGSTLPSPHDGHGSCQQLQFFRREGDVWAVRFDGEVVRLRDQKGLHYLARLLANPGRELHVLDLVGGARFEPGQPHHVLDAQAKESYRRRLTEIEEDADDARSMGDSERAAEADAERDYIVRELARAVGLGGRTRTAGSASERARVSVTRAVRHAMARIQQHNSALGDHLERAIRTGTYCAYLPDPRAPGFGPKS